MNNRMEILKKNGVDTGRYFTLVLNETIPAGTKINISIDGMDEVAKQIIEDGYVKNTKLHRRWVAAQYFRMLESEYGWYDYLNRNYDYMYQLKMMTEEVRVLAELSKRDKETFDERAQFFTYKVVAKVLDDYFKDMCKYIGGLPQKKCKGQPYVYVKGYGNVFVKDLDTKIINPIRGAIDRCKECDSFAKLHYQLAMMKFVMIKLPYYTKKSKTWIDAFQREGAFYTLKNLIMFHGVKLSHLGGTCKTQEESMAKLRELARTYAGYQMHAMLKKTIEANNFNFRNSIEVHN